MHSSDDSSGESLSLIILLNGEVGFTADVRKDVSFSSAKLCTCDMGFVADKRKFWRPSGSVVSVVAPVLIVLDL